MTRDFAHGLRGSHHFPILHRIQGAETLSLRRRHVEPGIDHTEGFQDALTEEPVQCLTGDDFHQPPQDVRRQAIAPGGARLVGQGNSYQGGDPFRERGA